MIRHELAGRVLDALLFEEPGVGRCLVAPDGTVVRANAEWLRSTGFMLEQVLGADIVDLFLHARERALAIHARARAGSRVELPRHSRCVDGRERWWDGSIAPVPMDGGTGLLITTREVAGENAGPSGAATDVTERANAVDLEEAQAALRDAHERLRLHVETMPLGVLEWDSEYRVKRLSTRAEQILGWRAEEVLGRRIDEIPWVPEEDWPSVRAVMRDMSSGARPTNVNVNRNVRKDGSVIYCEWYNSTVHDDGGRLVSVLSLVLDVTARTRAEAALRERDAQFRALIEDLDSGVALIDADGKFSLYNRRFLEMFGLSPDSDVKNINDQDWGQWRVFDDHGRLLHVDDHPVRNAALTGRPVRNRLVGVRPPSGGELTWMLVSAEPLLAASGEVEQLICTYHDVTDQRRAEETIRLADQRKSEFLAMLSHELRNPLAPIRNSIYLLERAAQGSEQATRAKEVIRRQAEHLARLVDDLLDMTRISSGKVALQRTRFDLREIARKTADDLRSVFAQAGVALRLDDAHGAVWIDADATRIAQVLGNLLHNSVKFTPSGGTVTVTVTAPGTRAELRVRDDGIGMEPGTLERMFEPFAQADQTLARTKGGLGLGLALVKGLIDIHGGTVEARSEGLGRGAEFLVRLPLAESGADGAAARPAVAPARPRVIVVIEDNVDAGQTLADILELHGHAVRIARDARSGLALVRQLRPDVVVCDVGLPDLDGYDIARTLRCDDAFGATRLVALSGYAQPDDRRRAREAGFDVHLAKPVEIDELMKVIADDA